MIRWICRKLCDRLIKEEPDDPLPTKKAPVIANPEEVRRLRSTLIDNVDRTPTPTVPPAPIIRPRRLSRLDRKARYDAIAAAADRKGKSGNVIEVNQKAWVPFDHETEPNEVQESKD